MRLSSRRAFFFFLMPKQGFKNQWIEISRKGKVSDSTGVERDLNDDFLNQVIANFTPSNAPITIGHPEDNAPAWGWATALRLNNGVLEAQFADTDDGFEQMVEEGKFRKRSASFYLDPPQLRHVGFLGAKPPAVKGLRDIQFNDGESVTVEISFNEKQVMKDADVEFIDQMIAHHEAAIRMVRKFAPDFKRAELRKLGQNIVTAQSAEIAQMREWRKQWSDGASQKTQKTMNMSEEQIMKEEEVDKVADTLMDKLKGLFKTESAPSVVPAASAAAASFSEADAQKLIDAAVAKAKTEAKEEAKAEFAEQIKTLTDVVSATSASGKRSEIVSFVESIPAGKGKHFLKRTGVVEFLEACANVDAANENKEIISFSEGEGDKKQEHKFTMLGWAKNLISALPPMIEFGEKFGNITATKEVSELVDPERAKKINAALDVKEEGGDK